MVYIESGSDITGCNMKCPHSKGVLELYRQCGGVTRTLLELHCYNLYTKNNYKARLHLDTQSGCWRMAHASKTDSCVYITEFNSNPTKTLSSTVIRVLDPVFIYDITSNFSRLGQDTAVRVQFSGEESSVTWKEDGEPLPERYRLIDDNRTLIIPSVQRDDAERTFLVRIANPVSEEIREHRLKIYGKRGNYWDPVLISNITSNFSRLGQDTAVSVNFSGEESHVTWEVDGLPLPERYRLIDDNRTLIIPSVQRDDGERRIRVRIANPVSEEIREYRLANDTIFIRMLKEEVDCSSVSSHIVQGYRLSIGLDDIGGNLTAGEEAAGTGLVAQRSQRCSRKSKRKKETQEEGNNMENGHLLATGNGSVPAMESEPVPAMESEPVPAMESEPVPAMESEPVPAMESEPVPAMESDPVPAMESEPVPAMESEPVPAMESEPVPAMESEPVPAMESEPVPAMKSEPVPAMKSEPVPAMENGFMSAMENWSVSNQKCSQQGSGRRELDAVLAECAA
ncbi:uncharacterized protein ACMZJ9_022124 [Mantella aurantiaca]